MFCCLCVCAAVFALVRCACPLRLSHCVCMCCCLLRFFHAFKHSIAVVVAALDTVPGDAAWDANADIDHDGEVDMDDLAAAAAQTGDCEKFRNRLPRASLRKSFLTPGGGASRLVRLDASRSGDNDNALVHVDFFVRSLITGESVLRRRTAPGEAAVVETELARGKYEIFITVMDRFGATSDPKRRGMVVK